MMTVLVLFWSVVCISGCLNTRGEIPGKKIQFKGRNDGLCNKRIVASYEEHGGGIDVSN